ncbi:hypothetical protein BIW11_03684 [Tropilaelaps mercedesae]|uniref:Uncharacterized protein n=1 Tax=Tropilaelaps mercedesae TaxID=418985 RepID=A0A1V9XHU4_9ACAR|nr:hypothetical protein BIW11_03684 [Tropilaelaps mercedesae]
MGRLPLLGCSTQEQEFDAESSKISNTCIYGNRIIDLGRCMTCLGRFFAWRHDGVRTSIGLGAALPDSARLVPLVRNTKHIRPYRQHFGSWSHDVFHKRNCNKLIVHSIDEGHHPYGTLELELETDSTVKG